MITLKMLELILSLLEVACQVNALKRTKISKRTSDKRSIISTRKMK